MEFRDREYNKLIERIVVVADGAFFVDYNVKFRKFVHEMKHITIIIVMPRL